MKKLIIFLAVIFFITGMAACGTKPAAESNINAKATTGAASVTSATTIAAEINNFPMTVKDSYDREVKIEKEPQRIISLGPNITETLFALGRGDRLVGRTDYCDYPAEALKVASVGTLKTPSIEKIAELKPDLVIASTHFSVETLKKLEELNIPTAVFYGEESFDGVYETISNVGKVLNAEKNADSIINDMKKKVDSVVKSVEGKDRPSVYYVVGYGKSGDYTAGKKTFIGQLIEMAGAKNAADDVDDWKYSQEKLLEKSPEIMICPVKGGFKQGLETTTGYKDLSAVKNGKLYEFDVDLVNRQGPRLAEGLAELAKVIHPDLAE